MSRARGAIPILLATGLGVVNGIVVFGPSFKEQQQEREEEERKTQEIMRLAEEGGAVSVGTAEAAASRALSTEKALKPEPIQTSWWPKLSLWSNSASSTISTNLPITETKGQATETNQAHQTGEAQLKRDHN